MCVFLISGQDQRLQPCFSYLNMYVPDIVIRKEEQEKHGCFPKESYCIYVLCCSAKHTQNLLMVEAHYMHGLHGLLKVVFVLLPWNWDVTIGKKTVVVEPFQKQVRCGQKNGKTFRRKVKLWLFQCCRYTTYYLMSLLIVKDSLLDEANEFEN